MSQAFASLLDIIQWHSYYPKLALLPVPHPLMKPSAYFLKHTDSFCSYDSPSVQNVSLLVLQVGFFFITHGYLKCFLLREAFPKIAPSHHYRVTLSLLFFSLCLSLAKIILFTCLYINKYASSHKIPMKERTLTAFFTAVSLRLKQYLANSRGSLNLY